MAVNSTAVTTSGDMDTGTHVLDGPRRLVGSPMCSARVLQFLYMPHP